MKIKLILAQGVRVTKESILTFLNQSIFTVISPVSPNYMQTQEAVFGPFSFPRL